MKTKTKAKEVSIPSHPQLYYRFTGDWKGWNDWLGINESDKQFISNKEQDRLEEIMFTGFKLQFNDKFQYTNEVVKYWDEMIYAYRDGTKLREEMERIMDAI